MMTVQQIKQRFSIIGNSPMLARAITMASQVAPTEITVLITGESGVGKEAFSQIIHNLSLRRTEPFIAINCGALPEGTINSELFGHEKGAFTGALDARKGWFEAINGGTIFLDEVGDMPLETQARLLRVLESGEFIRVGSNKVQKTDVRVIAATNVKLTRAVETGKFREDLYYRLSTVVIPVPSLRERPEDIHLLFRKFVSDFSERYRTQAVILDEDGQQVLRNFSWPGNVRQLRNLAEQLSIMESGRVVGGAKLLEYLPRDQPKTLLPAILQKGEDIPAIGEREIMMQFLMEMRRELSELRTNVSMLMERAHNAEEYSPVAFENEPMESYTIRDRGNSVDTINRPLRTGEWQLPQRQSQTRIAEDQITDIQETLSLAEQERRSILKSLEKHRGRRRDAARELGISERTLYRKIKEYELAND